MLLPFHVLRQQQYPEAFRPYVLHVPALLKRALPNANPCPTLDSFVSITICWISLLTYDM